MRAKVISVGVQNSDGPFAIVASCLRGRGRHLLLAVLLLLLAIPAISFEPHAGLLETEPLQRLVNGTNMVARAFAKEHEFHLYFTNREQRLMFKAKWKRPRVGARAFSYVTTTLEPDKTPPAFPRTKSHWREVRLVPPDESGRLLRAVADRLVPAEPGHGIYYRYALGETILFRERPGAVKSQAPDQIPEGIQIDKRYAYTELAMATAEALETDLRAAYPSERAFLLPLGRGRSYRLAYLDLETRQAVVIFPPLPADDARRTRRSGLSISRLASFLLVDNAWAFLKNPFTSSTRTIHQWTQWPIAVMGPHMRDKDTNVPPVTHAAGMDLAAWEKWLDHNTGSRREQGSLQLLIDGDKFFPLLEQRMAEAEHRIDVHLCIFDNDDVAIDLANLLQQRSTNVSVHVVYDRLMSSGAADAPPATPMRDGFTPPESIGAYLRSNGRVHVHPQPNPGFSCDHSKVILLDDRYAYIGGMNFGREYRYEWHDLMAEVEGPVVASLQREFDKKWAQLGIWGDCALAAACFRPIPEPAACTNADCIDLRRLRTRTFHHQIRIAERAAIDRASSYIYLENPYLFENAIIVALVRARARGVDVRVVMPAENDFGPSHQSNLVVSNYLIKHGVRLYFYPGMSHIKALLVDGWSCFGSANFDAMSLRINRESNLATSDPGFAQKLKDELFERDFAQSLELKTAIATDWSDELADALLSLF